MGNSKKKNRKALSILKKFKNEIMIVNQYSSFVVMII